MIFIVGYSLVDDVKYGVVRFIVGYQLQTSPLGRDVLVPNQHNPLFILFMNKVFYVYRSHIHQEGTSRGVFFPLHQLDKYKQKMAELGGVMLHKILDGKLYFFFYHFSLLSKHFYTCLKVCECYLVSQDLNTTSY